MIEITTSKGTKFLYRGRINIDIDDTYLCISASSHDDEPDHLYVWDKKVYDKFFIKDIVSIKSIVEENEWKWQTELLEFNPSKD